MTGMRTDARSERGCISPGFCGPRQRDRSALAGGCTLGRVSSRMSHRGFRFVSARLLCQVGPTPERAPRFQPRICLPQSLRSALGHRPDSIALP